METGVGEVTHVTGITEDLSVELRPERQEEPAVPKIRGQSVPDKGIVSLVG